MPNTTKSTRKRSRAGDEPLQPRIIKTEAQYEATLARIEQIFDAKPNTPAGDELELLLLLVEKYEQEQFPIDLPDPITAIRFRMEQGGLKAKDLIPFIGSKSKVSEVLSGTRPLSRTMIRKLVTGLGIPAEVLLQEPGAKLPSTELLELSKRLPLAEMHKRGWFPAFVGSLTELKEQIEEVLGQFTKLAGPSQTFLALNRQRVRDGGTADQPALTAWRIRVISEALRETLPTYHSGIITPTFMREVVKLSYLDNGPKLAREYLNKNGIHLVIERHLPKTYLDGAAIRLPDGSPLVALTLRHDRLDNFWFTLCHELAHVARHLEGDGVDVIFDDLDKASEDAWEQEADAMASEALIPAKEWKAAKLLDDPSAVRVKAFAEKLRIHPAIPAGRIRYEKRNYQLLGDLVGSNRVRRMFESETP